MRKKAILFLLSLQVLLLSASCLQPGQISNTTYDGLPSSVPVETVYGPVSGVVGPSGLLVFLGIPYAMAPAGEYRFRAPQEPQHHQNIFQANKFGNISPQASDIFESSSFYQQSEDCLNLNIWTPGADGAQRPVIVFIHGGGFISGSSADHYYDGAILAQKGNLVFVSINYRLGALGYLDLAAYGGQESYQRNCGLLDQVMALKWIKQNIANFGGDPGNVTLMGESAGAISATTLMSLPATSGLFRRVIAQSGSPSFCRSRETSRDVTLRFLETGGITDVNSLKTMSLEQLLDIQTRLIRKAGLNADRLFSPVIDGDVIPQDPLLALTAGAGADIELLHGTTKDEIKWWILYNPAFALASPDIMFKEYPELSSMFGSDPAAVVRAYRQILPGQSESDITHAMLTDRLFWIPQIRLAEAQATHARTWMYKFAWPSPFAFGVLGSYHSLDILFAFHNLDSIGPASEIPAELGDAFQKSIIAFARSGNPDHAALPHWPEYETGQRRTMVFQIESYVKDDPDSERRVLYKDIVP